MLRKTSQRSAGLRQVLLDGTKHYQALPSSTKQFLASLSISKFRQYKKPPFCFPQTLYNHCENPQKKRNNTPGMI
jgi:hypothetical protein